MQTSKQTPALARHERSSSATWETSCGSAFGMRLPHSEARIDRVRPHSESAPGSAACEGPCNIHIANQGTVLHLSLEHHLGGLMRALVPSSFEGISA